MSGGKKDHGAIAADLLKTVSGACPDMTVTVEQNARWKRPCLTFRWSGFDGLLPEERFAIIARLVPPDYVEAHCKEAVWVELASDETLEQYLALPRSEDVAKQSKDVLAELAATNFFAVLEDEMVRIPPNQTANGLTETRRILKSRGLDDKRVQTTCLVLIGAGGFNDWSVLREVRPQVESTSKKKPKKK